MSRRTKELFKKKSDLNKSSVSSFYFLFHFGEVLAYVMYLIENK